MSKSQLGESQVSHQAPKKEPCFLKREVEIKCSLHQDELIVRGCSLRGTKQVFWCTECILDDPEFIKKYKKYMKPIHEFLSDVVDKTKEAQDAREETLEKMPLYVNQFLDKQKDVESNFEDLIENEKQKATKVFRIAAEKVVEQFSEAGELLQKELSQNQEVFLKNTTYFKEKIDENYVLIGYPTQGEILEGVNSRSSSEAQGYINQILAQSDSKDQVAYEGLYDILHRGIISQLENQPQLKVPEEVEIKLTEICDLVKEGLDDISQILISTIRQRQVADLTHFHAKSSRRGISFDKLQGFMDFEEETKFKTQKVKNINCEHEQPISCITVINDELLVSACRNGQINVHDITSQKMVDHYEEHQDNITCIISTQDNCVISGGGSLDSKVICRYVKGDKAKEQFSFQGHQGGINCLQMIDQRSFVSGGQDGQIILYDLKQQEVVKNYKAAHNNLITCVKFLPQRDQLLSAGFDGIVKIWNLTKGHDKHGEALFSEMNLEAELVVESPIVSMAFSQVDNKYLLVSTSSSRLQVYDITNGNLERDEASTGAISDLVLVENRLCFSTPDFVTLNTNVAEDLQSFGNALMSLTGQEEVITASVSQPKVQLIQHNKHGLRMAKIINQPGQSYDVYIYEIV